MGAKRKFISKKTVNQTTESPILIIDFDYFDLLLESRQYYSKTPIDTKAFIIKWINAISNHILPKGIIGISEQDKEEVLGIKILKGSVPDIVYSLKLSGSISAPLCICTNNLTTWAVSNNAANLSFAAIDSNNRALIYNNKTGLDFFCKFLLTNKIINKLGLAHIKYLNLQYLYLIILYINFTNQSSKQFYFDSKYLLTLTKHINKDKPFSRSKGIGLDLVSQTHKFLSYAFLTKPEFPDLFLLGSNDYQGNLKRLPKLLALDNVILSKFQAFYLLNHRVTKQTVSAFSYKLLESIPEIPLSRFWAVNIAPTSTLKEISDLVSLISLFNKRYSNEDISKIMSILPEKEQKKLQISPTTLPKKDDTDNIAIDTYVSNLMAGLFNG